jgi:phospho-N-acetylmuramoyl-pentapeptide-transferase
MIVGAVFLLSIPLFAILIYALRLMRGVQKIYEWSPSAHQKKTGTVSMGGIGIVLFSAGFSAATGLMQDHRVQFCMGVFVAFGVLGMVDDVASLARGKNLGLTAKTKFALQTVIGLVAVLVYHGWISPLPLWQMGLFWFLFNGVSNATNLTDGLDGLLGGLAVISLAGFGITFAFLGVPIMVQLVLLVIAVICGFLVFNLNPARVFMGDTGSLALGAFMVSLSMVSGNPWALVLLGGLYLIETLSVMIQVASFKWTGKRVFKMAPLHHHFELSGWSEMQVVASFWASGIALLGVYIWIFH